MSQDRNNLPSISHIQYASTRHSYRGHKRRLSLVIATDNKGKEHVYTKGEESGSGAYGVVYQFYPEDKSLAPLAVKEFIPSFKGFTKKKQILQQIKNVNALCEFETIMYRKISYGIGWCDHTDEPTEIKSLDDWQNDCAYEVTSYQHSYMVMDYIAGVTFNKVKVRSVAKFFRLFIAALEELKRIHSVNVIHRDIRPHNIIVDGERIRYIDMSLAEISGEYIPPLPATERDKFFYIAPEAFQPKEKKAKTVCVLPSMDMYSIGILFEGLLHRTQRLFDNTTANEIKNIIDAMKAEDPRARMTLETALDRVQHLSQISMINQDLIEEARKAQYDFPDNDAINKWCLIAFERCMLWGLSDLSSSESRGELQERAKTCEKIIRNKIDLRVNYIEQVMTSVSDSKGLYLILSLLDIQNRMALLKTYHDNAPLFLARLFPAPDTVKHIIPLLIPFSGEDDFYVLYCQSKQTEIEANLSQLNEGAENPDLLDQWCLHQAAMMKISRKRDYDLYDYDKEDLISWGKNKGLKRLCEELTKKPFSLRMRLITCQSPLPTKLLRYLSNNLVMNTNHPRLLRELFHCLREDGLHNQAEELVQKMVAQFYLFHENKFPAVIKEIDQFRDDKTLYQQLLLTCKTFYEKGRRKDKRDYQSIFGFYSRTDKLNACREIDERAGKKELGKRQFANLPGAAEQGDLGRLTQRLKRTV